MFKKTLISIVLSTQIGFCAPPIAGANNIVFDPTNLATAMEQLTALNKQIESSIQMLDQFNKVNKVLEQSEQLLFNSYEKLYNPKRQIENIINNAKNTFRKAQRLVERIKNTKLEDVLFKNDTNPTWRSSILYDQDDPKWKAVQKEIEESFSKDERERQKANAKLAKLLNLKTHLRKSLAKESTERISQIYQDYFTDEGEIQSRLQEIEALANLMNEGKDADLTKQIQITNQITYKMADTLGKMYELSLELANNQALKELAKQQEELKKPEDLKKEIDNINLTQRSYMELKAEAYKDCIKKSSLGIPQFGHDISECEKKFQDLLNKKGEAEKQLADKISG